MPRRGWATASRSRRAVPSDPPTAAYGAAGRSGFHRLQTVYVFDRHVLKRRACSRLFLRRRVLRADLLHRRCSTTTRSCDPVHACGHPAAREQLDCRSDVRPTSTDIPARRGEHGLRGRQRHGRLLRSPARLGGGIPQPRLHPFAGSRRRSRDFHSRRKRGTNRRSGPSSPVN